LQILKDIVFYPITVHLIIRIEKVYKVKIRYDELEALSHIVDVMTPPFSLARISGNLGIPRIRVSRIIRRIQQKWWIMTALDIRRICLRKIIVLLRAPPKKNVSRKAIFTGKTIEDKFIVVFFMPGIRDPYEFIDKMDGVVSYYIFDKMFYNKPLFRKHFINGYLRVDLKSILSNVINNINLGDIESVITGYDSFYPRSTGCIPLSLVDRKIIEKLVHNGLLSNRALAKALNTAQSKINKRIRFLVKTGVLQGFTVGYSRITDMGEQLFWIIFIIKFSNLKEALYFVKELIYTPFIGHIDYDSGSNIVKLVLRVYKENIGYVYDIAKIIGEKLNVIDTMIVNTRTASFHLSNILGNNVFHIRVA